MNAKCIIPKSQKAETTHVHQVVPNKNKQCVDTSFNMDEPQKNIMLAEREAIDSNILLLMCWKKITSNLEFHIQRKCSSETKVK